MAKRGLSRKEKGGNVGFAEELISYLVKEYQVKTFCVCPGGRNAPLVKALSRARGLEVFSFFEERSASFFAVGRCKRDKIPCAVVTTSGTAVAELLPAVVEAYYSGLPLVLVTADRPSAYRGTGAPQSIEQVGIFSHYVEKTWDLESTPGATDTPVICADKQESAFSRGHAGADPVRRASPSVKLKKIDLPGWSGRAPCHINICFDEPLLDKTARKLDFSRLQKTSSTSRCEVIGTNQNQNHPGGLIKTGKPVLSAVQKQEEAQQIKSFFSKVKRPLCILAELPESEKPKVEEVLSSLSAPIYAEALSGLRESKTLSHNILKSGDRILHWLILHKKVDGVLRVGRRPCVRFWRDLEKKYPNIPILSVSEQGYSGLARAGQAVLFESFFKKVSSVARSKSRALAKPDKTIFMEDTRRLKIINSLLEKYPLSEPALVRGLSQKIPAGASLFLGNSLPIREWHLSASFKDRRFKYEGNRGANGIDGLLSSFFGGCARGQQNWCLLGDLSCLYDLSAPWILSQIGSIKCFIVIINNGGGRIFSPLFSDPAFINSHNLRFTQWAKMWGLHYYRVRQWPEGKLAFSSPAVIELAVDPRPTEQFNMEYNQLL